MANVRTEILYVLEHLMKREVIEDFLNLPGIAGIALMDGHSRPYFYGVDQNLNFQQKEALAQGIQQVVETTPAGFNFFEFQFVNHQIYIYKLDHRIVLLVLTGGDLVISDYSLAVEELKTELQLDSANAIATFRLMAGNISLTNQNYWKQRAAAAVSSTGLQQPRSNSKSSYIQVPSNGSTAQLPSNGSTTHSPPPSAPPSVPAATSPLPTSASPTAHKPDTLKDCLIALNEISQFASHYLGPTVVGNYWKSTRPAVEWLASISVDRTGRLVVVVNIAEKPLSPQEIEWLQTWTAAFIKRCSFVIRDFATLTQQIPLSLHQKLLLGLK
ncbi:hypothetical protein ACQ4M4_22170 [Leptolyngbya sp. AN02str]|uniref:hypothetical protein n=1 Tax=Leptolyngbya sp. AN02str TaxID=3423363 RepID=UPI003D31471B